MGAKDSVTKNYLSDNRRFADLCNYYLFDGEQVIRPEDLKEQDTTELLTAFGNNSKQKWRDLLKQAVVRRTDQRSSKETQKTEGSPHSGRISLWICQE